MAKVYEANVGSASTWRTRLHLGAYRYAEAARLAQTNHQLIAAWQRLVSPERQERTEVRNHSPKTLSYLQLIELVLVAAFRRAGVQLGDLAKVHQELRQHEVLRGVTTPEAAHPFVLRAFKLVGLQNVLPRTIVATALQRAFRTDDRVPRWHPLVAEVFARFEYDDRIVVRWYPRGREQGVVVDPRLSFGAPVVVGTGIPTYILLDRHTAGESLAEIAEDYGLRIEQVNAALSFEHDLLARVA